MMKTNMVGFLAALLVSAFLYSGAAAVLAQTATDTPSPSPTETGPTQAPRTGVGYFFQK